MIRTINVVFTNKKLGESELIGKKEYKFLCDCDTINIGDLVEDIRYSTPMQVVSWNRNIAQVQEGITLKFIEPSKIDGSTIVKTDYSEARNISVTLEQAREWYTSGNSTLRTLALNAYAENELIGYEYMKSCIAKETLNLTVPYGDGIKILTNGKLAIIAKYLNGSWKMCASKTGYFIGKSSMSGSVVIAQVDPAQDIAIYEHKTVQYTGIVYFKNAEDAKKAAKMLGDDIRYLF